MRHQTHRISGINQEASLLQLPDYLPTLLVRKSDVDHVSLYQVHMDFASGHLRQSLRQSFCIDVIIGQSLHMMFEGMNPGRSQKARLPHPSTNHFPPATSLLDEIS